MMYSIKNLHKQMEELHHQFFIIYANEKPGGYLSIETLDPDLYEFQKVYSLPSLHATPADCASHSYNRGRYDWIAPQMVHNDLNVVIGGGAGIINAEEEAYLKGNGFGVFKNDINGMRSYTGNNMWALYADHATKIKCSKEHS